MRSALGTRQLRREGHRDWGGSVGKVPDSRNGSLADSFFRWLQRPQNHIRIIYAEEAERRRGISTAARDAPRDQRILMFQRELHGVYFAVGSVRLESKPLQKLRIAVLILYAEIRAVYLPADQWID